MLTGCQYHLLHTLLPPLVLQDNGQYLCMSKEDSANKTKVGGHDFLRLEFLCACKIMQDMDLAMLLLPMTPHRFFPALFQAAVQKSFYLADHSGVKLTTALGALVTHWPWTTMTVRDLLPPLPVPAFKRQRMQLKTVQDTLHIFLQSAFKVLPNAFMDRKCRKKPLRGGVRRLDVSGTHEVSEVSGKKGLEILRSRMKTAYDPNAPPDYEKNELILDLHIDSLDTQMQLGHVRNISDMNNKYGAGLVIRFRNVRITSASHKLLDGLQHLLEHLVANGTECLELELIGLEDDMTKSVLVMSQVLKCLSIAYSHGIQSLQFLTLMLNLVQLNLSGINLQGKCATLSQLPQGLKFLKVVGCRLRQPDLDILCDSKHVHTLQHLDISENSFGNHSADFDSFCKFIKNTKKLSILEVENCSLHNIDPDCVEEAINVFTSLSRLSVLRLTRNDFPKRILLSHLTGLGRSSTLRCLCLTTPSEVYLSDDYTVIERTFEELSTEFIRRLCELKATHLAVDWSEEPMYSRWFYTHGDII